MSVPVKKIAKTLGYIPFGYGHPHCDPFGSLFEEVRDVVKDGLDGIDALILWGGEDIHPSLYNQKPGRYTFVDPQPSRRDILEWNALKWCLAKDVPTIGICRGAQMGCAFAGGKLIQHVDKHTSGHAIMTADGHVNQINSVHHQMMYPFDVAHEMLAWAHPVKNETYLDGDNNQIQGMCNKKEPEIVFFPKIRMLAIQGHPEYGTAPAEFKQLAVDLTKKYLF